MNRDTPFNLKWLDVEGKACGIRLEQEHFGCLWNRKENVCVCAVFEFSMWKVCFSLSSNLSAVCVQ